MSPRNGRNPNQLIRHVRNEGQEYGLGFHLTYIDEGTSDCGAGFDTACMRRLYAYGDEKARSGRFWLTAPPSPVPCWRAAVIARDYELVGPARPAALSNDRFKADGGTALAHSRRTRQALKAPRAPGRARSRTPMPGPASDGIIPSMPVHSRPRTIAHAYYRNLTEEIGAF